MMTRRMQRMMQQKQGVQQEGAPRQAMLMGEPHMLAYINEAERQMLKRAGGAEAPGPEGIPVYGWWANTFGGGNSFAQSVANTFTPNDGKSYVNGNLVNDDPKDNTPVSNGVVQNIANSLTPNDGTTYINGQLTSDNSNADSAVQASINKAVAEVVADSTVPYSEPTAQNALSAYDDLGASLTAAGLLSLGGKQTPVEPANPGNPPILEYDGNTGEYTVVGALDPTQPISISTNADGTPYVPYGVGDDGNPNNPFDPNGTNVNNPTGDPDKFPDLDPLPNPEPPGPLPPINDPGGLLPPEYPIDGGGTSFPPPADPPYVPPTTPPVVTPPPPNDPTPPSEPVAPPVNQALLDALARRDAALAQQMGNVSSAFGFSTDDYYKQLGTDYREGGLSEAFTTAYDDAIRGIYDVYKSAGMLTQSDVDDDMGILAGANSGEAGRMDSIVDQYTAANRNYVTEGRGGIEGDLRGFVTDTEDIPTIDAQTASILGYDVAGRSQPFKTPKEGDVVEFFTDFVKRAYDPSYNVDPTAVASGGPKKVSGSVDQLGAGTQPSTIAGILDPVKGGSVKVVG